MQSISNEQTVNSVSHSFPCYVSQSITMTSLFWLQLRHYIITLKQWLFLEQCYTKAQREGLCMSVHAEKEKNSRRASPWLLFSPSIIFCLPNVSFVCLSPVQRYIAVNILMHAGLQLIIVQMYDCVWFGLILSYLYYCWSLN